MIYCVCTKQVDVINLALVDLNSHIHDINILTSFYNRKSGLDVKHIRVVYGKYIAVQKVPKVKQPLLKF